MTFQVLTIIVVLNVIATLAIVQAIIVHRREAARRPPRPTEKFITELLKSEPIAPQHESPKESRGEGFPSWLFTEGDRLFFADFAELASVINTSLAHDGSPWRLQELPDTELDLERGGDPSFGRRYTIFHNQVRLGTLEVFAGLHHSTETPEIGACIDLEFVRLLSYDTVQGLLIDIASHVCDEYNTEEFSKIRQSIDRALTQVLWKAQQFDEYEWDVFWGNLKLHLYGSAPRYFRVRETRHRNRRAGA